MIKLTSVPPDRRMANINSGVNSIHGASDSALLNAWGVQIGSRMVEVQARVLPTPTLSFAKGKTLRVQNGSWHIDAGMY